MQVFKEESDENAIELRFPDTWAVLKYDDPEKTFYPRTIKATGADLSAVDFVVNTRETPTRLLLIEVKNFRNHDVENRKRIRGKETVRENQKPKPPLDVEISRNVLHTLAALYLGARMQHKEVAGIAPALLPAPGRLQVVLLLETDPLPIAGSSGYLSDKNKQKQEAQQKLLVGLQTRLLQKLKPLKIQVVVYNCQDVPARDGWEASTLPLKRPAS
jgi:hypothetical protein